MSADGYDFNSDLRNRIGARWAESGSEPNRGARWAESGSEPNRGARWAESGSVSRVYGRLEKRGPGASTNVFILFTPFHAFSYFFIRCPIFSYCFLLFHSLNCLYMFLHVLTFSCFIFV